MEPVKVIDSLEKEEKEIAFRRELLQKECDRSFLRSDHLTGLKWYQRINYLNSVIVFGVPIIALYGILKNGIFSFPFQTWIFALIYYIFTGLGITAGYHRLWSHISYQVHPILEYFLMLGGSGALQGSIKFWSLLHRAHHRYTDTDSDPYNARRGFWYAHVGWLLYDSIRVNEHVEMEDLRANSIIRWQHKHYAWFGPFMSLIFPAIVAWIGWGDIRGGFYIVGALRLTFVQHATWCVNSVAHYFGKNTFDDAISPKDNLITGLMTFGEGYHNFHHEFASDYRNGIHFFDYDPTKWFIWTMAQIGLAYNLNTFSKNEIQRGELDMKQKLLNHMKKEIDYGVDVEKLPVWNDAQVLNEIKNNHRILIIIQKIVHDVTDFVRENKHPGGKKILIAHNGVDSTLDFNGNVYNHTNAARNLMSHFRVAKYVDNDKKEN